MESHRKSSIYSSEISRSEQNDHHLSDDISECFFFIFYYELFLFKLHRVLFLKVKRRSSSVQVMVQCLTSNKILSELMMLHLLNELWRISWCSQLQCHHYNNGTKRKEFRNAHLNLQLTPIHLNELCLLFLIHTNGTTCYTFICRRLLNDRTHKSKLK